MRQAICVLLLALSAAIAAADSQGSYDIGCPIPARRVAVMNLKVQGEYSEQVRDWLPALIEDRLLQEGWTLVVRGERMRHIQEERGLGGVKPDTQLPDQEILAATAFLELSARVQVKDIQGLIGYRIFQFGDFARASVDLNGQVVDPATSVLKSSVSVGGSASGLKAALTVYIGQDWKIGGGGYNLKGIRESLVGKAADVAAQRLVAKLKALYPCIPSREALPQIQPASTTVTLEASAPTILIALPDSRSAKVGDRLEIMRGDVKIAEVEVSRVAGMRAEARVVSQTDSIKPSDRARRIPIIMGVEPK